MGGQAASFSSFLGADLVWRPEALHPGHSERTKLSFLPSFPLLVFKCAPALPPTPRNINRV